MDFTLVCFAWWMLDRLQGLSCSLSSRIRELISAVSNWNRFLSSEIRRMQIHCKLLILKSFF